MGGQIENIVQTIGVVLMHTRSARGLITHFVLFALAALTSGLSHGAFLFTSDSVVFDRASDQVRFTINFNQSPDFLTLDSQGRQTHSFQYFIIGDASLPGPASFDAIIRGEELHISGNALRVRNASPPDPDPAASGWGSMRGSVPFALIGEALTFTVPLSVISDHSVNGLFAYQLESYEFGNLTRHRDGQSSLPAPATVSLLAIGAVALCLRRNRRR
jgi:hypothetical protein